jgi:hypothetical protein
MRPQRSISQLALASASYEVCGLGTVEGSGVAPVSLARCLVPLPLYPIWGKSGDRV